MDEEQIKHHWQDWARSFGTELRATTKSSTAKRLELDALTRAFSRPSLKDRNDIAVLEIGCGNGVNCLELAGRFPTWQFDGVDYVEEMVGSARRQKQSLNVSNVAFFVGNAAQLDTLSEIRRAYDIVFTDRCLINLETVERQKAAISQLAKRVAPGGYLALIENSQQTHSNQNDCRETLGLERRRPAEFNLFFDDNEIVPHLRSLFPSVEFEEFISLHDLVLYVLVPSMNGGVVDYEHPLVKAAATLNARISAGWPNSIGPFGQNRLYLCHRPT